MLYDVTFNSIGPPASLFGSNDLGPLPRMYDLFSLTYLCMCCTVYFHQKNTINDRP